MKAVVDTNVLVRLITADDAAQNAAAAEALDSAAAIVLTLPMLCELAWVLARGYRLSRADIGRAMQSLIERENATVNRPAVEAGLAMLEAGGDFADGVIAFEGRRMGGETFLSFDRRAVQRLEGRGERALLLA